MQVQLRFLPSLCCFESAHIIWVSALFWLEGGGLVIEVRCVTFIRALWSPAGCASSDCVCFGFGCLLFFFFFVPEPEPLLFYSLVHCGSSRKINKVSNRCARTTTCIYGSMPGVGFPLSRVAAAV